ncbi:MAG: hypothetical protein AABY85_05825 [Gemmatimonadota bacterium]
MARAGRVALVCEGEEIAYGEVYVEVNRVQRYKLRELTPHARG